MITFETQVEFEAAVMKVLHDRLTVHVHVGNGNEETVKVEVALRDNGAYMTSDEDRA